MFGTGRAACNPFVATSMIDMTRDARRLHNNKHRTMDDATTSSPAALLAALARTTDHGRAHALLRDAVALAESEEEEEAPPAAAAGAAAADDAAAALQPIPSRANQTGFKGVYPARNGRWQAQVGHKSIGGFSTAWEAGVAGADAATAGVQADENTAGWGDDGATP